MIVEPEGGLPHVDKVGGLCRPVPNAAGLLSLNDSRGFERGVVLLCSGILPEQAASRLFQVGGREQKSSRPALAPPPPTQCGNPSCSTRLLVPRAPPQL